MRAALTRTLIRLYLTHVETNCLVCLSYVKGLLQPSYSSPHAGDEENRITATQPHSSRASKIVFSLAISIVLVTQVYYYYIHLFVTTEQKEYIEIIIVDIPGEILSLLFPWFAPLHRALGYFDVSVDARSFQGRINLLVDNPGTHWLVQISLLAWVLASLADFNLFMPYFPKDSPSWMVYCYAATLVAVFATFYGSILFGSILSTQALLTRLLEIESTIDVELVRSCPSRQEDQVGLMECADGGFDTESTYFEEEETEDEKEEEEDAIDAESNHLDERLVELASGWTESYHSLLTDTHNLSEAFGSIQLAFLFLIVLETTGIITVLWDDLWHHMGPLETICALVLYCCHSILVCTALSCMAYLGTRCSHHIGPKVSVLASRYWHIHSFQPLSSLFLGAALCVQVGNVRVGSEFANFVTLWFTALFLAVFGVRAPGDVILNPDD